MPRVGPRRARFFGRVGRQQTAADGRIGLCHALNTRGGVHSEFTIFNEGGDSFYLVSAGALQRLDHDWLQKHLPASGARFDHLTNHRGVLVVAGPKSRELMQRVSAARGFFDRRFPWLSGRQIDIGPASTLAVRVNFVGEMGWELHHPIECQNRIFDELFAAGEDLGIAPFGIRAMDSLRVEKSYKLVGQELSIEYAALESGLSRFVRFDKGDFVGRDALREWQERGFAWQSVTLEVRDVEDADALGNNAIFADGKMIGRATSGQLRIPCPKIARAGDGSAALGRAGERIGNRHFGAATSGDCRGGKPV